LVSVASVPEKLKQSTSVALWIFPVTVWELLGASARVPRLVAAAQVAGRSGASIAHSQPVSYRPSVSK
jgi:hypothetical protein